VKDEENVLWVSKEVLNWNYYGGGGEIVDRKLYERSYRLWEHSNFLIENATNDFQLADGIMNLKRCLNHRLQLIENLYKFKEIDIEDKQKSKGYLELLQKFGIVRPTIMKTLMDIRNGIEHRDENPPDLQRSNEFVDIIWYFLKSTDYMVNIKKSEAEFRCYDSDGNQTQNWCEIELLHDDKFSIKIRGLVQKETISNDYMENAFQIIGEGNNAEEKHINDKVFSEVVLDILPNEDKLNSDIYFSGEINLGYV
jgi:hypothetical protein